MVRGPLRPAHPAAAYFLVVFGFGALGLLDDLGGDRSVGGFRGHFAALWQRQADDRGGEGLGGGVVSLAAGFLIAYPDLGRRCWRRP